MKIQPEYNNVAMTGKGWSFFKNSIKQKIIDAVPQATIKDGAKKIERWKSIDEKISKPAENRLIMGATALVTQPVIDYNNHKVDKETRRVSRNRTIAKILAGTSVGIVVRGSCYSLVNKMTELDSKGKYSKALIPESYIDKFSKTIKFLRNYKSALSTGLSILAMCITNFAIDAPLTVYLTNKLNAKTDPARLKNKEGNNG